jgi:hypothetical protein
MSTILDEKQDNVAESSLPWVRSLLRSTDLRFGYVPEMTANSVKAGCDSTVSLPYASFFRAGCGREEGDAPRGRCD